MKPAKSILREGVYEKLRERIIAGGVRPEEPLGEERLAAEFGVSRTPLREALRQLAEEGLVEYNPFRGARVVRPTPKLVEDVFLIREALEGVAAREAALRADAARLAELRAQFEVLRTRVNAGDLSDVGDGIHEVLFLEARNDRLLPMMKSIFAQVQWFQHLAGLVPGRLLPAFREHESILSALEARDAGWAESAARAHIRNTLRDLQESLASGTIAAAPPVQKIRKKGA